MPLSAWAQRWETGFVVGAANYFGDLNPKFSPKFPSGAGNILVRRNLDGRICIKGSIGYAHVWADDKKSPNAYYRARNLNFSSHVFSGSLQVEFNFQPYHSDINSHKDKKIAPYLTTGLGMTYFNPRTTYEGVTYNLRDMGTEGQTPGDEYRLVKPEWVIGGGFKIDVSRRWSVNIEIMSHLLFTDYLDDVHGVYADSRIIAGYHGDVAAALADRSKEVGEVKMGVTGYQRGDTRSNDMYITAGIGLVYRFMNINCPAY